ncbi:myo-inositol 2-dehydrogenase [Verticillium dahliae]
MDILTSGTGRVPLNVGIIGCGEVAQVVHIPTLSYMSSWFRITYLCDFSEAALKHCAAKIPGTVKTTRNPELLCTSEDVDVILVASSDEYHAEHALAALKHHKHVLVEKSLALTKKDIGTIAEAERHSRGSVMVGYMRRYAAPVEDAIREVGGMDKVFYAPVRDIIGANLTFVNQSGTFPERFTDFRSEHSANKTARHEQAVNGAPAECGDVPVTKESSLAWRVLCGLGSHDLSLTREVLGMPTSVKGSSLGYPFWNDLFKYPGFTVSYESGIDNNPRFDAHLEGLPVTMHIAENYNGTYKEATIRKTYEDPYTHELKEWWNSVTQGMGPKTTTRDAAQDLEIFGMAMKHHYG